jgi:membrane-associated phospholipid phosphatase
MALHMSWNVAGWAEHLIQWIAPSTIVCAVTTTGSQTSVTDLQASADQPTAATPPPAAAAVSPRRAAPPEATEAGRAARPQVPLPPPAQPEATAGTRPVQPEATAGTSEPLRETVRHSLVPRWLARLRTQAFTGVAVGGLIAFASLAALVTNGLTAGLDLAVTLTIQGLSLPWFGPLMLGISLIGFPPQAYLIVAGAAALFFFSGYRTESGFAVAAAASAILTETFKRLVARPRPGADLVNVFAETSGNSFPSGHVLFYVTFFGFLAYLAYAQLKPGRVRTIVLWLTGLLILLIGPSRIWMGQHWASDVMASYALGLTYLVVLVQVYSRRRLAKQQRATPAPVAAG